MYTGTGKPAKNCVRIVSFQDPRILSEINANGFAVCHVPKMAVADEVYMDAYNWMVGKMKKRIGSPKINGVEYPIWGWANHGNRKKEIKPYEFDSNLDELAVINMDIPENELLLSDFDLWHYVLNKSSIYPHNSSLGKLKREAKKYGYRFWDFPIGLQNRVMESWELIFDLNKRLKLWPQKQNRWIQATFWQIKREWIRDVKIYRRTEKQGNGSESGKYYKFMKDYQLMSGIIE